MSSRGNYISRTQWMASTTRKRSRPIMFDVAQTLYYAFGFCAALSVTAALLVRRRRPQKEKKGNRWVHTKHYGAVERYLKEKRGNTFEREKFDDEKGGAP